MQLIAFQRTASAEGRLAVRKEFHRRRKRRYTQRKREKSTLKEFEWRMLEDKVSNPKYKWVGKTSKYLL